MGTLDCKFLLTLLRDHLREQEIAMQHKEAPSNSIQHPPDPEPTCLYPEASLKSGAVHSIQTGKEESGTGKLIQGAGGDIPENTAQSILGRDTRCLSTSSHMEGREQAPELSTHQSPCVHAPRSTEIFNTGSELTLYVPRQRCEEIHRK